MQIKTFEFSSTGRNQVLNEVKGRDWPVVYLINNEKYLYIGETSNFYNRFGQHLENRQKRGLKEIHVIFDDEFNKSAVLDIEQCLIRMCSADQKLTLLNGNAGQSSKHNYYQREKYLNKIEGSKNNEGIWDQLKNLKLVNSNYEAIVNSDLFTYSPYTSLTVEQEEVCYNVIRDMLDGLKKESKHGTTCIINGSAGTGKTILAVYIMSLLANANTQTIDTFKDEESFKYASFKNKILHRLKEYIEENGELKIGYVLPMTSIRATLKTVFNKNRNGLRSKMVIGPTDVVGEMFDILLVDETHRISKRKNLSWIGEFDKCCKELNMKPEKTNTLDWIVRSSKHRILFYDKDQSIKPSDISIDELKYSLKKTKIKEYKLVSQMRCEGGNLYINYLEKIFKCTVTNKEWILRKESINEIGCIHTTQGYDLNYVGVVLGNEIDYDPIRNEILIDSNKFYDTNVKKGTTPKELKRYIVNSYKVMMARGIKGCYIYACNKNMNEYLKKYFN